GTLQAVDTAGAGDVEQDASRDDGARLVDAAASGALLGDGVGRKAVVEPAAVADVSQGVPVGRRLQAHGDGVVARGEVVGVAGERHVDGDHAVIGIVAAGDDARLGPV